MKIWPGLGNHDYYTNMNKCGEKTKNECVNRILDYFIKYVKKTLKRKLQVKEKVKNNKRTVSGTYLESQINLFSSVV